jgi:hypothetical protein
MVRLFLNAAGKGGNALMGSGILGFALAIWQAAVGSISAVVLIIIAGALFGWGAYLAFAKEHALLEQEQEKNGRPEFSTHVEILHLGDVKTITTVFASAGDEYPAHTYRIIMKLTTVNVRSHGSSIRNFVLTLTTQSHGHVATLEPVIPIENHFELLTPGPAGSVFGVTLQPKDAPYLMDSIKGKKLEQGSHETGWLGFSLKGELLKARELCYDLKLIDGYGTNHACSFDSVITTEAVYSATPVV